ncbi:MAG: heme-copper oxidase subunit III [Deltaproteobacteria bacterium]|nr:MAG: heme-copper oxidase subunit III [Deltaproteobacteria bacterium]
MAGTMSEKRDLRLIHPAPTREQRQIVPNEVLGMILFIGAEVMLFAGLISAYAVVRAGMPADAWPPPGQPRLPIAFTGFNTLLLLASGGAMWFGGRKFAEGADKAVPPVLASLGLGAAFVALQGYEWANLLGEGLSMQSSPYGSFFYLIVGTHAVHAVAALLVLSVATLRLRAGELTEHAFTALRAFWYFVVLIWPFLYWQVYL